MERKVDQKKEALATVLDLLGGRERMTEKLYRRFADRRTFTTEDLRELSRLFKRAVGEKSDAPSIDDENVIVFRRRIDGMYSRSE